MKKFWINFLCCFIPFARVRHRLKRGEVSPKLVPVIIIENGKERLAKSKELRFITMKGTGKNNTIKIEAPIAKKLNVNISYANSNNNCVIIHKNVWGNWSIGLYDSNNTLEIGEGCECCSVFISLIGNELKIGNKCMLSNNIHIWGDGHSVLDFKTGEVLNKPKGPIVIGDHCWIGERVTLTKNAQIPNDCIVGIASVVTKKFTEEHCLLAGAPAKVVKTGITWHGYSPLTYEEKIKKEKNDK